MSANPQWDIRRALGVARLFHLACGLRDACVTPFLTLYLRQLGLAAPWVGILMGTKHLVAAFWGPFCAFLAKSYQKRRVLLTGSLLGSVGASLLLGLVPPLDEDRPSGSGNASHGAPAPAPAPPPGVALTGTFASSPPPGAPGPPAKRRPGTGPSLFPGTEEASGFGKGPAESVHGPSGRPPGYALGPVEGAGTTSRAVHPVTSRGTDTPWEGAFKVGRTALPLLAGGPALGSPANGSAAEGSARALGLASDGWRRTFFLCLGSVVLWELLTAPLEQVADDSLYEYLDFVDATDRYRSLWIWRLLGTTAGVCGIAALVGQLECPLVTKGPRGVLHFYGYSLVSTLALLLSIAFPVPTCRPREPSCTTVKALSLAGGDPRLLLLALTVFLAGAAASTVQNFLFWHMQDLGSSELVMGFSVALGLLGETALHPFKTTLLRKLTGAGTVGLGLGCLAGQLLYYSLLWSWWSVLPAQVLSALSSGALWWAVKASVEHRATPGTERPLGAMFRGHFSGAGASLGSFGGGFVVTYFGLAVLYQACCVVLMLWLALFVSVQHMLPQEQKINYAKLLVREASDTSDSEQGTERDWLVRAMREEHSD